MPKVTSVVETAIEYLKDTALPRVDGGDNYWFDIPNNGFVTRMFLTPDDIPDDATPTVCIVQDGTTSYTAMTGNRYTTGGSLESLSDGVPILLVAYIANYEDWEFSTSDVNSSPPILTSMNQLHGDLIKAIHTDTTLGGCVHSIQLVESAMSTMFAADKRVGTVMQSYSLKYDFDSSAATSAI